MFLGDDDEEGSFNRQTRWVNLHSLFSINGVDMHWTEQG